MKMKTHARFPWEHKTCREAFGIIFAFWSTIRRKNHSCCVVKITFAFSWDGVARLNEIWHRQLKMEIKEQWTS